MIPRPISSDPREPVRRDGSVPAGRRRAARWREIRLALRRAPLKASAATLALSVPACLACALLFDVPIARAVPGMPPGLREVARIFSDLGLSGYMLVLSGLIAAGAYGVVRRGGCPDRRPLLRLVAERAFFVFAAVALSGIAVQVVKHVVGRARPGLIDRFGAFHFDGLSFKASLASFPSGHSTSIFALAAALGLIVPKLRWPVFGLAALVGIARVLLGAHYASDILAGALFGVAATGVVASLFASRSIAFTRVRGALRLKGRGTVWPALRPQNCGARTGA